MFPGPGGGNVVLSGLLVSPPLLELLLQTATASQPGATKSKSPACELRDWKNDKIFRPSVNCLKSSACPPDRKTHLRLWLFRGDGSPNIKLHMLFVPATEALTSRAGRGDTIWGQGPDPTNFTKF